MLSTNLCGIIYIQTALLLLAAKCIIKILKRESDHREPKSGQFQERHRRNAHLYLLRDEDLYGYQLTQLFAAKSLGTYTMLEGTLYSILFRMVAAGYLSEYEMLVGKKRKRRYYHLEESGKVYFEQLVKEFDVVVAGINRILDRA